MNVVLTLIYIKVIFLFSKKVCVQAQIYFILIFRFPSELSSLPVERFSQTAIIVSKRCRLSFIFLQIRRALRPAFAFFEFRKVI